MARHLRSPLSDGHLREFVVRTCCPKQDRTRAVWVSVWFQQATFNEAAGNNRPKACPELYASHEFATDPGNSEWPRTDPRYERRHHLSCSRYDWERKHRPRHAAYKTVSERILASVQPTRATNKPSDWKAWHKGRNSHTTTVGGSRCTESTKQPTWNSSLGKNCAKCVSGNFN